MPNSPQKEKQKLSVQAANVAGGKRACEKHGLWFLSNIVWAFLQATEIYINSCFLELLQTVQGNGSCSWNSLKRTLSFTLIFRTDLDQVNFSFCTGNKVPLFSKVCIPVFLTGICQHRPCIAMKIPLLLNTWSKFCSACENVFSFIHLDTQQIRMCMEKHHCRFSNIQE